MHSIKVFEQKQTKPNIIPTINIIKQNRILINYKKLNHFENCFLRSRVFLRKNFDIIHSQIKATTESAKKKSTHYTNYLFDNLSVCDIKNQKKTLKFSEKIHDQEFLGTKNKRVGAKSKRIKKNSNKLNVKNDIKSNIVCSNTNLKFFDKKYNFKRIKSQYKFLNKKLDDLNNLIENNLNWCQINNLKKSANDKNSNCDFDSNLVLHNSVYTSFEFLVYKSLILTKDRSTEFEGKNIKLNQIHDNQKHLFKKNDSPTTSTCKNEKGTKFKVFRRYNEFSKNMIEFTLHLHRILFKIDRVISVYL